ncbi:MAG: oxidoreductase, partial [Erysipelotrichaceae bacterium]|nr:oxidoreductase [Erysipelotrichaceae bacterium]
MIYKDFQDIKLSGLGLGTMRLPILNNNAAEIDEDTTAKMFDYAIKHGI